MTDQGRQEIEIPVTQTEKQQFQIIQSIRGEDAFAEDINDLYAGIFGDIHPEALESEAIDTDAIIFGELEPADVADEYKIGHYDPDATEVSDDD